jgi:hypothetical protein
VDTDVTGAEHAGYRPNKLPDSATCFHFELVISRRYKYKYIDYIASDNRINEWKVVDGMKTGRGNGSSRRNSARVLLCKSRMT